MDIKPNDHKYTEQENEILDSIKRDIIAQLEKSSIATVYRGNLWHGESFHKNSVKLDIMSLTTMFLTDIEAW